MKIFYIHHACRKISGTPSQDDSITSLGKKDAKLVAKLFARSKEKFNIKAIYTSTFLRCKKTAEIINKKLNVPLIEDARFNEFKSVANETWQDCQKRLVEAINEIVDKYEDNDTILCVTSGVNLTAFVSVAYNISPGNGLPFPLVLSCSPIGFEISTNITMPEYFKNK